MYTAGAQHSSSRLSLWRPAAQEKLLLCVDVAGPWWASPEKRSRPAHGWKGRPRSWQRSASWYQPFCFLFAGTRRSLVPDTKTKTIFFHTKTKISRTHTRTDFFLGMYQVSIRKSLRSNYKQDNSIRPTQKEHATKQWRGSEQTHWLGHLQACQTPTYGYACYIEFTNNRLHTAGRVRRCTIVSMEAQSYMLRQTLTYFHYVLQ